MLRVDNMMRFTLSQVYRDRGVQLNATFNNGLQPYTEAKVRVVTEPIVFGNSPGYALDRRLKNNGQFSERILYGSSFLRIDLIGGDLARRSGFASVAVGMYRPGKSYDQISFKLDTKDFFMSEMDRGNASCAELLFNSRQDCAVNNLLVATAGIAPVVGSPKRGGTNAYYERFGFGRYVVGLDIAQYLASWGAFFPEPKEAGDMLGVDFIVTVEPPFDFLLDVDSSNPDDSEELSQATAERIAARYQLQEEPSLEAVDFLEFCFHREIRLTEAMLGLG
ncbi:MAG: hypothetical protein LBC99_10445 [Spirochaetota bacterium]|jgi:hypothetical protein|nr:hypothetical protein [Spirochaetota bacterium]